MRQRWSVLSDAHGVVQRAVASRSASVIVSGAAAARSCAYCRGRSVVVANSKCLSSSAAVGRYPRANSAGQDTSVM